MTKLYHPLGLLISPERPEDRFDIVLSPDELEADVKSLDDLISVNSVVPCSMISHIHGYKYPSFRKEAALVRANPPMVITTMRSRMATGLIELYGFTD